MGPGIFVKAVLQGSFSLMVFGWTQIVMDLQPLWVMVTGDGKLHGFSHTYLGALLIAAFSALTGKYLSEIGLRILVISKEDYPIRITWWVCFLSAYIGSLSHVLLDGIMHADVTPFFPVTDANHVHGLLSVTALYDFCRFSGIIGGAIYFLVRWRMSMAED